MNDTVANWRHRRALRAISVLGKKKAERTALGFFLLYTNRCLLLYRVVNEAYSSWPGVGGYYGAEVALELFHDVHLYGSSG